MKIWKVRIRTIYFGYRYFDLFVAANSESTMIRIVRQHPTLAEDKHAIIDSYEEVDLNDEIPRVL